MNEIYKFAKGKPLNSELVGIARFELLITDANGSVVGTVDPEYMFCGVAVYPGAAECLIVNEWDMTGSSQSFGNIKDLSAELYEEGKLFSINDDRRGVCWEKIDFYAIKFTEYGKELFDTYSYNTV